MPVTEIRADAQLDLPRESAIIAVPVYGAYDLYVQCIKSIHSHTSAEVPLLIADDGSADPAIRKFIDDFDGVDQKHRQIYYLRHDQNIGFVANMNAVFSISVCADVVVVNSDCIVSAGWFESLRAAVYSDSQVATATTLTNHGTIVSVPYRNRPQPILPQEWSFEVAAGAIRAHAQRIYPRVPTAIGHCLYIRRSALELVGGFDDAFSPGYGEEVDFSQRCLLAGLEHVVADDVLIFHAGNASFSQSDEIVALRRKHDAIISSRYPYYDEWVNAIETDDLEPLARAVDVASRALRGLSVTIDGRILGPYVTGTQVQTLELIRGLSAQEGLRLRVVIPRDIGSYAREVIESLSNVEMISAEAAASTEKTDIVHRPYQLSSTADLDLLTTLGERLIITQLDLIAYQNPGYFPTFREWWAHREFTRWALAVADTVIFISMHSARSAVAYGLVDPERASVVHLGTDHAVADNAKPGKAPRGARKLDGRPFMLCAPTASTFPTVLTFRKLDGRPFMLCLGTDFRHKNRGFALRLLHELRAGRGWDGGLVFAGPHVPTGSSAGAEAAYLAQHPELERHVVDLAAVDDVEKAWLLEHTAAVLYPTVREGFGLLPFEAAQAAVPCLFAPHSSLAELFPDALASLVPWDVKASSARVFELLTDDESRHAHVAACRAAGARLSWDRTAREVRKVYEELTAPTRNSQRFALIAARPKTKRDLIDDMLVGLPYEMRRALVGAANRRFLRAVLLGPFLWGYRLAYLTKHRKSARKVFVHEGGWTE